MALPPIPKKFIPLIIAGVLGLIAVVIINNSIEEQKKTAGRKMVQKEESMTTVVVAKDDIPEETRLKASMLKEQKISRNNVQPGAAVSIERVEGKVTASPISKGQQILLNSLTVQRKEASLSTRIPKGKRAVTISIDNIAAVGGLIRPGDHVDVVGMVPIPVRTPDGKTSVEETTMPLFQNVLVLVGGDAPSRGKKESSGSSAPSVTLALSPEEANLITFAAQQGKIKLVLRAPDDTQIQPVVPASWETLLRAVLPQASEEQKAAEEEKAPQKTVEIIRGAQKETKVLQ